MQLKASHLFFFLLAILLVSCLGNNVVEAMSTNMRQNTNSNTNVTSIYGPDGGSATKYTGPQGNSAISVTQPNDKNNVSVTGPNGQTVVGTPQNTVFGITSNQIPSGDEDLYILKSEVVPPVCPACPQSTACPREKPCPACPPCARCPEPAFECKKVPNYASQDNRYLPKPLLNDFSAF